MPDSEPTIPIACPHCEHHEAHTFIVSSTVAMLRCAACAHRWAVELASLPPRVRKQIAPTTAR